MRSKHECVCVCMRASDLHQIRCCPGCFHNAFLQLYSWYGEQKSKFIVIRNSYGFRYVQNKIKQQKQNTHRHKPHPHPKPKKNTKAISWLLQDPKTSNPGSSTEMCSKHRSSKRAALSEEEKVVQLLKVLDKFKILQVPAVIIPFKALL